MDFYAHDHAPRDTVGRSRYVNPGSLGWYLRPVARSAVLSVDAGGGYADTRHGVPRARADLFAPFERREVPERAFILQSCFGPGPSDR